MKRTRFSVAFSVAAFLAFTTIGIAPAAQADTLDLTCAGTHTVTYSPGVTLTPTAQTVGVNLIYAPCQSLSMPEVISGHSAVTVTQTLSCLTLAEAGSGTIVITWNTGETSQFASNRTVTNVGGNTIVTNTGVISAGLFAGDAAVQVIVGPAINLLDCLQPPGITERFSVVTLAITSVP